MSQPSPLFATCQCGQQFQCEAHLAGQQVPCPSCGATLAIPKRSSADVSDSNQPAATGVAAEAGLNRPRRDFAPSPTGQSSVTLDDRSRASNPGDLNVNYLHWFSSYPVWPLVWLLPAPLLLFLAITSHWAYWIPFLLSVAMNYLYWMRVKEHFLHGCTVPGVVLSLDPMILAFATDMSTGHGEFPAIKIVKKELKQIHGETPQVGMRLAGVALYGTSDSSLPHWEDFDPRPVQCAVPSVAIQQQQLEKIDEQDFQELLQWLQPVPHESGLYFIQPDGTAKKYTFHSEE